MEIAVLIWEIVTVGNKIHQVHIWYGGRMLFSTEKDNKSGTGLGEPIRKFFIKDKYNITPKVETSQP